MGQLDAGGPLAGTLCMSANHASDLRHTSPGDAELTWAIFGRASSREKVLTSSLIVDMVA